MKIKLISIGFIVLLALFIITCSIALPILIRPFYYMQIDALGLEKESGLEREEIIRAYDEMMDYCMGFRSDFSAGGLPFSESGASHFADVRGLFIFDLVMVVLCGALLITAVIVLKKKKITLHRFCGRSVAFWSVISIFSIASVIGISCAISFKKTFVLFHKIFFPGKTDWKFNPYTDPIIDLLPNQFFSNCAILIFIGIALFCVGIMLYEFLPRRNKDK